MGAGAGTWDGANEQLSRVIDVHSIHLAGSGVRPAGADIDVTSRITSAPAPGSPETPADRHDAYARDRGAVRLDPDASRSKAYQP